MIRRALASIVIVGMVAAFPLAVLPTLAPDATAPKPIERLIAAARNVIRSQFDQYIAHIRFVDHETRESDQLVVLYFEVRAFPYLTSTGAYLISRCVPLAELDATQMDGGIGVDDFANDDQPAFGRSEVEQGACP
jgi:hypothetical protein